MTKINKQQAEKWGGVALNFVGGMLMQSKIGIGVGLALEATGDYLTQKGMGVKDVNKKKIAESVGISLAETLVFAGAGKVAGNFLKSRMLGVAARDANSMKTASGELRSMNTASVKIGGGKSLRSSMEEERISMSTRDAMLGREDVEEFFHGQEQDKLNMLRLKGIGRDVHPKLKDVEVRAMYVQDDGKKELVGYFDASEVQAVDRPEGMGRRGPEGTDSIFIASRYRTASRDEPIPYNDQEKEYLHEASHGVQKFQFQESGHGGCCHYGHGEDFKRYHNITVIRAYGTGHLSDERFLKDFIRHYHVSGPGDELDVMMYLMSLKKDFEELIGHTFKTTDYADVAAFKAYVSETSWDYVPRKL